MIRVIDDRKRWMIREDCHAQCFNSGCHLLKKCMSLYGKECKHIAGQKIPKVGD